MSVVSIVIPLKKDQGYLRPCVEACLSQKDVEVELIVLPDEALPWSDDRIRCEVTGPVSPARKRNRGVELCRGEVVAFIDDDTRPLEGWLAAALPHFQDAGIGAVGGPSVTPRQDPFWAQVSGAAYESWMLSGSERLRYVPTSPCDVEDFPSCNLLVRKEAFQKVGGFGTDFWPGEDTEFCLSLIQRRYRIRYEPKAVIEHHRRPTLRKHFQQLTNYGLHRGHFAKRFPETSCRLKYFVPSIVVLIGMILLALSVLGSSWAVWTFVSLAFIYIVLGSLSLWGKALTILLPTLATISLSHLLYGIFFIKGLILTRLPEETQKEASSVQGYH